MSLTPGARLGVYELVGPIGKGGMGEVYRARDPHLQRDVAIKVLPALFAQDAERLARFAREAQTLAALNHPNIAQVYGLVSAEDGGPALVMELVEGDDLSVVISRGPIPVTDALPMAAQVADALHAAHEQGIVHRDLKPANVKLRPDGTVKVLDFGLAKAMDPRGAAGAAPGDPAHSPTFTSPMTEMGIILGTAAYMAPEQARGRAVDKRADIWAFGCLLFEMLTARRAFLGDDVTETITAIMRDEPDWSALPPDLPRSVERFLRRCFARNPRERVQDAGDLRLALDGAFEVAPAAPPTAAVGAGQTVRRTAVLTAAALVLVALAGAAGWWLRPTESLADTRIRRFTMSPAPAAIAPANTNRDIALSPDGNLIAYMAVDGSARNLYVRRLDSLTPTLLRRADAYFEPFISPDGRWIAFNDEDEFALRKIAATGGPPLTIGIVGTEMLGATWGDNDTIVYATSQGLWRVPAAGGTPALILKPDAAKDEFLFSWPEFLPGSRTVLFAARTGALDDWTIKALDLESGVAKLVVGAGTNPMYVKSGHLLYVSEQTLHGVAFDAVRVEASGDAAPLVEGVLTKASGAANVAVADDGALVYMAGGEADSRRELLWLDRDGKTESLGLPPRPYAVPRLSPDGARIALDVRDGQGDIWLWDVARRGLSRLTTFAGFDGVPLWMPDSRRLVFSSLRDGPASLFVQAADGTGTARRLLQAENVDSASAMTPDGTEVIYRREGNPGTAADLMIARVDGSGPVRPLLASKAAELNADVSPDGKWIAYESNESGTQEVYVRPFPNVDGGRWQVSYGGGFQPLWGRDSRELFFTDAGSRLYRVPVTGGAAFVAGTPIALSATPIFASLLSRTFDLSRDGKRLLIIRAVSDEGEPPVVNIVQNWTQLLK